MVCKRSKRHPKDLITIDKLVAAVNTTEDGPVVNSSGFHINSNEMYELQYVVNLKTLLSSFESLPVIWDLFRFAFRDIIRNAVRASEHDAVIFVGSGCTAAIHKLVNALDLQMPPVSSHQGGLVKDRGG